MTNSSDIPPDDSESSEQRKTTLSRNWLWHIVSGSFIALGIFGGLTLSFFRRKR